MARDNGIGKEYEVSYPVSLTLMAFTTIAFYNVIELTFKIFMTFKRRNGLYFYSLLASTWGILIHAFGFFFKYCRSASMVRRTKIHGFDPVLTLASLAVLHVGISAPIYVTFIVIGWPMMITGQSLVLYSRLHLIMRSTATSSRWVLYMIIFDAIICHVPITVFLYGANLPGSERFLTPFSIYEKIQITVFFLQEVIISLIYLYKTSELLRAEDGIRGKRSRRVMTHLIWVNVIIIALDVTLLAIEYAGYYDIQTTYKSAVYSVKLKMEFSILNRLLDLFQGRLDATPSPTSRCYSASAFANPHKKQRSKPSDSALVTASSSAGPSLGHSAYARMDDERVVVGVKDREVLKTTEVRIESSTRSPEECDFDNMEIKSIGGGSMRRTERSLSVVSSEINMARYGY